MIDFEQQLPALEQHVIGRQESYFKDGLAAAADELDDLIRGSTILVIGGAGSIGEQTLRTVAHFEPQTLHVIDHNENALADLVRGLRSDPAAPPLHDFLTLPFDIGGDPFRLWLQSNVSKYDAVLNFAALKHVRSEKDPFSILAMLETNVLHLDRLSQLLAHGDRLRRVFSVSTDKAANPSSMMGATKRLMEHALFLPTQPWADETNVTSARFANVAFSNGSLLNAWHQRLFSGHPLSCPEDTRRFFVSLVESGHLCTLAAFACADRAIAVPALDPAEHLVLLSDVATSFLRYHGYEAYLTHDETEAFQRIDELRASGRWPLLLTPLDTGGEKPYEEFVAEGETVRPSRFESLLELDYLAPRVEEAFPALVSELRLMLRSADGSHVSAERLKEMIATVEPSFAATHRASTKSLDQRM